MHHSAVKSPCSSREPGFDSQHLRGSSEPSVTPFSGNRGPLQISTGTSGCTDILACKTHTCRSEDNSWDRVLSFHCVGLRYWIQALGHPLVSEVSLLRLEIEHILGNSGALAPVSGTVSVPFPGCNILKVQYGENFDHLQSSSSCWMESTGLFTHDWVERGWHLTSLTRWKLSLSLPSPLF